MHNMQEKVEIDDDASNLIGSDTSWMARALELRRLVEARQAARSAQNYATADRIRDELVGFGVTVEDRAEGPIWKKSS
ncbi:MAG: hypothetical protein AAFW82_05820 [Pseudomonadota bacterium]